MANYYGMNPPFIGGPQNVLSIQEDEKLIKNDLLQLLFTVPGERVYRPDFGTPLRSALFENNTQSMLTSLEISLREAITKYEPRVIIKDLSLQSLNDENSVSIKLIVALANDPRVELSIERFIDAPLGRSG